MKTKKPNRKFDCKIEYDGMYNSTFYYWFEEKLLYDETTDTFFDLDYTKKYILVSERGKNYYPTVDEMNNKSYTFYKKYLFNKEIKKLLE